MNLEDRIRNSKGADLKRIFTDTLGVKSEHVDFILRIGKDTGFGADQKLRQLYWEVLHFDLKHGTRTSDFISEDLYRELAESNPETFANTENVRYGVKHRSSLTSVVRAVFNQATNILRDHGINPEDTHVVDLGCGTAKPSIIARTEFTFGEVVGVDYFNDVLELAKSNRQTMGLSYRRDRFSLEFADASDFRGYRDPTVVYMYNPFGQEVMQGVEENLRRRGLKVVVGYNKPLCREIFSSDNGWNVEAEHLSPNDPDQAYVIFSRNL